jgi:2-C-methyl-D-erythritol 4-phosphate cytidylyltransferase
MNIIALIMAGGNGNRMEAQVPKQFLLLNGKPILMHTLERFHSFDPKIQITVVLPPSQIELWKLLCAQHQFTIPHQMTTGGATRFESVKNGLQTLEKVEGIVAIHDGVRPFVSNQTLERCIETAQKMGNAIPVIKPFESVRQLTKTGSISVNRDDFALVQTPQTFDIQTIVKSYKQDNSPNFTDDASVLEKTGQPIHLVDGNRENIKITEPIDLILAQALSYKFSNFHEEQNIQL